MSPTANNPGFLYSPGFTTKIRSHNPPAPFGCRHYKKNTPEPNGANPTPQDNPVDYVFKTFPIVTKPLGNVQETTLTLDRHLTAGRRHGARVFTCRLTPKIAGQDDDRLCAKIYDPLYYEWHWEGRAHVLNPVVRKADVDYSREAAAYQHAQKLKYDGRLTPKFYGCWTFTIKAKDGIRSRPVRLILMEYIDAPTLYQAYYNKYVPNVLPRKLLPPNRQQDLPDRLRLEILRVFFDLLVQQTQTGLIQQDYAPRNIIAQLEERDSGDPRERRVKRVALIDYNISIVEERNSSASKPANPISSFWHAVPLGWEDWVPIAWQQDGEARRRWAYHTFGGRERRERYAAIPQPLWKEIKLWIELQK